MDEHKVRIQVMAFPSLQGRCRYSPRKAPPSVLPRHGPQAPTPPHLTKHLTPDMPPTSNCVALLHTTPSVRSLVCGSRVCHVQGSPRNESDLQKAQRTNATLQKCRNVANQYRGGRPGRGKFSIITENNSRSGVEQGNAVASWWYIRC